MALTVAQQQEIHGALRAFVEAAGASGDNPAAQPALVARRYEVRAAILGPFATNISEEKFWCLFDEMWNYIIAGTQMANELAIRATGQGLTNSDLASLLVQFRRQICP